MFLSCVIFFSPILYLLRFAGDSLALKIKCHIKTKACRRNGVGPKCSLLPPMHPRVVKLITQFIHLFLDGFSHFVFHVKKRLSTARKFDSFVANLVFMIQTF